jgi:hypothetical protein
MTHGSLVHLHGRLHLGPGDQAGCSVEKAIYRMSIARADQSIAWARGRLTAIRYRRQWEVS